MLKDNQLYCCHDEAPDLFWDLSVELVEANRHGQEGCKLHHHLVWTDTVDEDDEQPRGLTVRMIRNGTPRSAGPGHRGRGRRAGGASARRSGRGPRNDWDDHLGWNAEANIAAAEDPRPQMTYSRTRTSPAAFKTWSS
jgi:hypothetical protein